MARDRALGGHWAVGAIGGRGNGACSGLKVRCAMIYEGRGGMRGEHGRREAWQRGRTRKGRAVPGQWKDQRVVEWVGLTS